MPKNFRAPSIFSRPIPFHPWIYFFIFLAAHTLLSYFPFSWQTELAVAIGGLLLPFGIGLKTILEKRRAGRKEPIFEKDLFPLSPWLWVLFGILLLFTRFWKLTTLPFWPLSDEGITGFIGMGLSRHWSWNLLWTEIGVEPMTFWLLGLYFKVLQPSLLSFRLFPALISLLTPLAAYWAARQYFPRFFAFLFTWLTAFSFWEFSLARLCIPLVLCPLFQCLCLGFLGVHLKADRSGTKWGSLVILTLLGGLGFYVWTVWAATWLVVAAVLLVKAFEKPMEKKFFFFFGVFSLLPIMPLVSARLSTGGMVHIHQYFTPFFFKPLVLYWKGLFWDGSVSFPYGSNWGGFLNPILGSLVLLGILYFIGTAAGRFTVSLVLSLILAFLPGILTNSVELYRILLSLPLLTLLAAAGLASLLLVRPGKTRWLGATALAVVSLSLDIHNYIGHYCAYQAAPAFQQWRNVQYSDAYGLLRDLSNKEHPLYVFSEFNTDYDNKTLEVTGYPFDALHNPSLSNTQAQWGALIVNAQYAPYFTHRFPGVKWRTLKTDKTDPNDPKPFGIFLIPLSQIPSPTLQNWIQADQVYRELDFKLKNKRPAQSWSSFLESVSGVELQMPKDPFLTAVYWEKMGFFKILDGHFIQATEAYQKAVEEGFPARHLLNDLAFCLNLQGRKTEAQKYLRMAGP